MDFEQEVRQIICGGPVIWERATGQASDGTCSVPVDDDFVEVVTGWQFSVARIKHRGKFGYHGYAIPEGGLQRQLSQDLSKFIFEKASHAGDQGSQFRR
jgi:hypothetical protein